MSGDRFTSRNRFTQPGYGAYPESWGEPVLNGVLGLIDESADGLAEIDLSGLGGAVRPLLAADGLGDEARCRVLRLTGAPTAPVQVVLPAVEKLVLAVNATTTGFPVALTCTASSIGVALPWQDSAWIGCDGLKLERLAAPALAPAPLCLVPPGLPVDAAQLQVLLLPVAGDAVFDGAAPPRLLLGAPADGPVALQPWLNGMPLTDAPLTVAEGADLSAEGPQLVPDLGAVRRVAGGALLTLQVTACPQGFAGGIFVELPLRALAVPS